ncbi:hypothetical protein G5I_06684 [Acromyrmex echinatior]|uniref:Uncharacterized protein n=1 Tax=Acromyrmex echinatior TaxID=103372 RepID=F4WLQ8_ACREC|nr:hypothetical protein G5I_06684 [Acromyrmex echinatior]
MVPSHMPDMAPEQDTKYRPIIGYHILSQALALLQSENQWYPVMPDMAHNRIPRAQRYYLLARDSSGGPRRRTTRVVSRCLRMKEPGRPPPSHPPSAVRPPRGGKRARSLYCKPSEQRGNGEDDDDGEDDNNVDPTPYTISGRARRRPREKRDERRRRGRTRTRTSGENRRHVCERERERERERKGAIEWWEATRAA